ncbi:Panacea domain-containing protein [Dyadobacter luticola]|nr:Panacea domain-containing protein [Dyadobacter luticola]
MPIYRELDTFTFRKEKYTIYWHYSIDEDLGEKYTTLELDELNVAQVHNQYREKYRIPFPEVNKLVAKAEQIIAENNKNPWDLLFVDQIFENQAPSKFNGYRRPDLERISNMISFFDSKVKGLYKTKLNKLLFYADFMAYSRTGFAISGISYRAIQFGPVPSQYQKMYIKLCDDAKLTVEQVEVGNGNYGELITSKDHFNDALFTKSEIDVLQSVCDTYGKMLTTELVEASHLEKGWLDNQAAKSYINFQEAAFEMLDRPYPSEHSSPDTASQV